VKTVCHPENDAISVRIESGLLTEQAIDFLMMDALKNRYLPNGNNYQDARLSIYLPGNGGLLFAVAVMCTSDRFPKNGK
jgi:protein-glucosylgalactosylhydroxylysine glucosidase